MQALRGTRIVAACVVVVLAVLGVAEAQNPTGTLTGRVTEDGQPLPGVTVSVASESLPGGAKAVVTEGSGDYILRGLPGGVYTVTFTLPGFRGLEAQVKISVAQTRQMDAEMVPEAAFTEVVEVQAKADTVATATAASATVTMELLEALPVPRDINAAVLLTPGTSATGAYSKDQINIAGQLSMENLILVNGVVTGDTKYGNPLDLYIEDAMQETTTTVSGVSAEYGRFTGGVINMVTKSGGNQFTGSYRLSLANESWSSRTPLTTSQKDEINEIHELTLGGYAIKDHLWFFLAGRDRKLSESGQTVIGVPFDKGQDQQRYEGKLTVAPTVSHRVMGSYMQVDETVEGVTHGIDPLDLLAIGGLKRPQRVLALNYTGTLGERFFLEGQYSKRKWTEENIDAGVPYGDRINGTMLGNLPLYAAGNHPFYCSECPGGGKFRSDNEDLYLKGSWFLSTQSAGSHDLVFGYDRYADRTQGNYIQNPADTIIFEFLPTYWDEAGIRYPIIAPGAAIFSYYPVLVLSDLTDFRNEALFVNDTWRVNSKLSLNLGLRYDRNDGVDGNGVTTADDSRLAPRLGASWDVKGDGKWIVNASAARYASMVTPNTASFGAGDIGQFIYLYLGPPINTDGVNFCGPDHPELCQSDSHAVLQTMWDWFDSVGGFGNLNLLIAQPSLPGVNIEVPNLNSQYSDEISLGIAKRLGEEGVLRADYVYREGGAFYAVRVDTTTGHTTWTGEIAPGVEITNDFDREVVENDSGDLTRVYHGIHTSLQYRFNPKLSLGASYTWSHLYGNAEGENELSGFTINGPHRYPEYWQEQWYYPEGDLAQDSRHKLNAYLLWTFNLGQRHSLSLSWLEHFHSGTPYGAVGYPQFGGGVLVGPYVQNPGYVAPPQTSAYYYTARDAFHTDDVHSTSLAADYSFTIPVGGVAIELYVQPKVANVFNEDAVVQVNRLSVTSGISDPSLALFNPFAETPVEGVHWRKGDQFGKPNTPDDYQLPRTFTVSFGARF